LWRVLTRWAAAGMAVLVAAALCAGCGKSKSNPLVMTVDGQDVTAADVLRLCPASTRNQAALEALERALVEREAAKLGVKVSDDEVKQVIDADKKAVGGDEAYEAQLAQSQLTTADVADAIRVTILQQKIVTRDVVMTESEVKDWYDKHPESFGKPAQAQYWVLQTKTRQQAEAAIKKVREGADFETVAQQDSSEPIMDYGRDASWNQLPPPGTDPTMDAIIATRPGEMSPPVEVQFGADMATRYRVAYVIDKKDASLPAFEEVKYKAELLAKIYNEKAEDPTQLIPRLLLDYKIEVRNNDYAAIDQTLTAFKQRRAGPGAEGITIPQETPPPGEGGAAGSGSADGSGDGATTSGAAEGSN